MDQRESQGRLLGSFAAVEKQDPRQRKQNQPKQAYRRSFNQ